MLNFNCELNELHQIYFLTLSVNVIPNISLLYSG